MLILIADFFVNGEYDLPAEDDQRQFYRGRFNPYEDFEEDVEKLEKRCMERLSRQYARDGDDELEELNQVDQQALLPSVRDPKLWMVKCAVRFSSFSLHLVKFNSFFLSLYH